MVTIVLSEEDSLGANDFNRYCGNKEAEECDFHGCVEGFLKNGVLRCKIVLLCVMIYELFTQQGYG